ncbi:MAG: hypothetical protein Q8918_00820 [Bacteroidota bacterium]|nr:hypothetical protein [Bacteroidota bacterium]MDP4211402.1 hypothetical protein [Bacteroidota bacterium]MDP4248629.1 hypothetical protein [Bacteroidota bacterium]
MRLIFCMTAAIGLLFLTSLSAAPRPAELKIGQLELGYPCPAIPFYHLRAQLQLPNPSVIEVEVAVNGKVLRFTDLQRETETEDINRPSITHRPPSGAGLSQDNTVYSNPFVTGWVRWQPGDHYQIKITVRMKKGVQNANDDVMLSATKIVTAPTDAQVFDTAWKSYKSVVVSETAGVDRSGEPVKVLLPFYPDEVKDLKREIRVMAIDPKTHILSEVPSQVYDVQRYMKEDDLSPDKNGKPTRQMPIWLPTVTAQVAFLADVPARSSRVYLIYYNNESAVAKMYSTDLRVQGEAPGLQIDNSMFTADLNPNSGHLDQITLKTKPNVPLFHRMETNGAIHWNPEIYTPPLPWTHTSDWNPPDHIQSIIGPVISFSDVYGHLKEIPQVDASVRYEFYPGKPYFISSSSLRINETVQCLALRNAEIVFKRELFSHAAWYDVIRDSVVVYDVAKMADLMDIKMEADVPWISFFDETTGIGFAGIQLSYANAGLESAPRLLNPYFYITAGPWIYWARALSLSFLASNMQQMIPAMKGNFFSEKWAYLVYETDKGDKPYAPVIAWMKKLTHPLRVELSEEVDDRVSRTVTELLIDKGKSGWENRETGNHHIKK